jgi:hypothetical protein
MGRARRHVTPLAHSLPRALDEVTDDLTVLPAQFSSPQIESGERRLWLAVLENAICLAARTKLSPAVFDARQWLTSLYPGAYGCAWVCEHLGIAVGPFRRALRQYLEQAERLTAFTVRRPNVVRWASRPGLWRKSRSPESPA